MTAVFRAGTTATAASSPATATVPSAILAGDLMVLVVSYKAAFPASSIDTPSGWSVAAGPVTLSGAVGQAAVFTRKSDGTEGGTTLSVTATGSAQQLDYVLAAYSQSNGVVRNVGFTDQGASSTSIACASQTSAPGDLILAIAGTRGAANGGYSFTAPGGYAVDEQVSSVAAGAQNQGAVICEGTATGSQTITASIAVWSIAGQLIIEPAFVPQQPARHRMFPMPPARRRQAMAPQATAYVPPAVRPRPKFTRLAQRRPANLVPAQVVVTPPNYVPRSFRARILGLRIQHSRWAQIVPPQVVVAPTYVPNRNRPPVVRVAARRSRSTPAPLIQAFVPVRPRRTGRPVLPRRPRGTSAPPTQAFVPMRTRHTALQVPRQTVRSRNVTPLQAAPPPNPAFVAASHHAPRIVVSLRRLRAAMGVWAAAEPCVIVRPDFGVVTRPGSGTVTRPNTGTVTRTSTGYVIRPNTGTVNRPGCHD